MENFEKRLRDALAELFLPPYGAVLVYRESFTSTNDLILEGLSGGKPPAIIAVANSQTRGRGRQEHRWFSVAGKDITTSLGFYPTNFGIAITTRYALACAVLVARALQNACGISVELKWPNDLVIGQKKIGGILVLNLHRYLVTGIGINVNSSPEEFPEEVREKITTVKQLLGHEVDRACIIYHIAKNFLDYFLSKGAEEEALLMEWASRCRYLGKKQRILVGGEVVDAIVRDIDRQTGELVCEDEKGNTITLSVVDSILAE